MEEVEIILDLVDIEKRKNPSLSIAIITFYKPQLYAVMEALKKKGHQVEGNPKLEVMTVDSAQGSLYLFLFLFSVFSEHFDFSLI
jgi:hypothetical protein